MSDSYHPIHSRPSGSARYDFHEEDLRSQSTYYTTGTGAAHYGSPAITSYPRSKPHANVNSSKYPYPNTISNSDLDCDPYIHYPQQHPLYQHVPRPGGEEHNFRIYQSANDPDVQRAITRIGGHSSPNLHKRTSARQPQPTSTEHHHSYRDSCHQRQDNSRKLGMTNLRELNNSRSPVDSMRRRARTDPQDEPYDAAGYVGRQSDYDQPDTRSYLDDDNGDFFEHEQYEQTQYGIDTDCDEDFD